MFEIGASLELGVWCLELPLSGGASDEALSYWPCPGFSIKE